MKNVIKKLYYKLAFGRLNPFFYRLMDIIARVEYGLLSVIWRLKGPQKPTEEEISLIKENVTFIFKSFERGAMATQLYRNIQKYYPGVRVIIADDSRVPLKLDGDGLTVINLPFNSGLGYGIGRALKAVETPFLIRMDDDELLTPFSNFHKHLKFLLEHPEVDIVAVSYISTPYCESLKRTEKRYFAQTMANAPKKLKIPHMTPIGSDYIVLGKVPNVFLARTEGARAIGYDDNIRVIDHHEFFFRAAGELVSVMAPRSFVFHRHNHCDINYRKFRLNFKSDSEYIRKKHSL